MAILKDSSATLLALLVAALATVPAAARENALRLTHYSINDGLSQSSATAILEDHRGFLWIGTQDGLNRFDGYEFTVYRQQPGRDDALASNIVSALHETRDDKLWIGTSEGALHVYDRDRDTFDRYLLPKGQVPPGRTPTRDEIGHIFESTDSRLWIGTSASGLWEFDRPSATFRAVPVLENLKINSIAEGADGTLWIGTSGRGLIRYRPESGGIVDTDSGDPNVFAILRTTKGELWTGGDSGLIERFAPDGTRLGSFTVHPDGPGQRYQVRAMLQDPAGGVWIGSIGGGLQLFSPAGTLLANFRHQPSDPHSLRSDTVFSLELDRAGVLWAGSLAAGVSKVRIADARFNNYWHRPENQQSISHSMVNEIVEAPDGKLWIGTNGGGVNLFDRDTEAFRHFRHDAGDPRTLSSDRVWGLHLAPDGLLWVGTWGAGLNRLDPATGEVVRFPHDAPGALPGKIVTTIVGDGTGGIWVGTADAGLAHKPPGSDTFEQYALIDAATERERPVNISTAFRDSRDRLWVGTWTQGLCVRNTATESFSCHYYDAADSATINANNIRAINEDAHGNVWVATANGIARYDEATGGFERWTSTDGLPPGTIYGVVPVPGALWVSSNEGLCRIDTNTRGTRHYNYYDGLQSNEFNGGAYLAASDGTLFFGGVDGLTGFRPEDIGLDTVPPKIALTQLKLFDESITIGNGDDAVLSRSITETDAIQIDYDDNVLTLEYAGLHFASPERLRYAHRLEGFDRDWVYRDASHRSATYTNLDPGRYVFRVRAANPDGVWSEQDATLSISVNPAWWMTYWARVLFVFVIGMTVLMVLRWRVGLMRQHTAELESEVAARTREVVEQRDTIGKQARDLEELLEAKNKFFARLSHEFRTPITLMLGPIEEQLEHAPPAADRRALQMARRNGRRLLHIVNQLLGLARSNSEQAVETEPTNLSQIARLTADSFMPLVVRKGLAFDVRSDDDAWLRGNPEGLQIIISNLVSNAVKYTPAGGAVRLAVGLDGSTAWAEVTDDGVGIPKRHLEGIFRLFERGAATGEGSGIGLTLVKELVEAHGGRINLESSEGEGTSVRVEFPALATNEARGDTGAFLGLQEADLFVEADDVADESPEPLGEDSDKPRILIVEDNRDMREYLASLLAEEYEVVMAADGLQGVDKAVRDLPDLVISDVMMPSADGFELLRELRSNSHTSHIPVIMLTALDDQESRLTGLRDKADDYVTKPFDRRELVMRVRNLLELSRIRARRMGQLLYSSDGAPLVEIALTDGLGARDREFLKKLEQAVARHYQDAGFRIEQLADSVFMSPRQLQRKMKALLDTAPAAYLRDYRLKQARALLADGRSVSDVAFASGFSSVSYFGRCFKSQFGISPSEVSGDTHRRSLRTSK